ncbi:MAG TPA: type II secretion system F family protein [Pirellulaceae bacterium]|nr:type II secretion system F family protein [Pirellulaceae bacterium]HMO90554.1 type II secretion system F family protein [Pirellulaceae bacterium]HMP71227.1 type II secretion system F family protein [Pirellulaceae bacterium]
MIDLSLMIPFAVFIALGAAAWFVLDFVFNRNSKAVERLNRLQSKSGRQSKSEGATDFLTRKLEEASPALAKPLLPKSEKETSKLKEKLDFAGFRRDDAVTMYLGIKAICLVIGLILGGGLMFLTAGLNLSGLMRLFVVGGLFLFAPDIILSLLAKKRKEAIFLGLPDALDLLVVCVEAGLGLDQAMRKVAEELDDINKVLAYEFNQSNMEVQMGKTREDVFNSLGARNGVDDLKTLASVIIQTDKFGSSVAKALRVMSDSMRTTRRQIAEEKAAKTAVKLIFPLVLFIFPGIFVVLVGPAAITVVREMLPAMQNR